ncbi:MAG: hypothetical protein AAB368_13860, partial [bacterium]
AGRHFERMEREAAEAGEAEYRARRGAHPRLADVGITGAHRHRITTWHVGQDPGNGEWFRPFGRLAVGIAEPEGNPVRHEEISAVPPGWRVRTVTRGGHRVRLAFPSGRRVRGAGRVISILHPAGENLRQCNPLTRNETARVLREMRRREREASRTLTDGAPTEQARSAGGAADALAWTYHHFGAKPQGSVLRPQVTQALLRRTPRNPAYSGYFTGKGGVTERYFRARDLLDAKRQMTAYARAHGLRPSTVWQLKSSTSVGRRFAGEWARPLASGREVSDMAKWLDNPRRGRGGRFVRSRHGRRHHATNRRHHRRHYRRNPDAGVVGAEMAMARPADYLMQAAVGAAGLYGVVGAGNLVGGMVAPTMYADPSITGKVVRAGIRLGIGYLGDMTLARNLSPRNRAALRVGGAVGIIGSLALDMLGTTFTLGAGDNV